MLVTLRSQRVNKSNKIECNRQSLKHPGNETIWQVLKFFFFSFFCFFVLFFFLLALSTSDPSDQPGIDLFFV